MLKYFKQIGKESFIYGFAGVLSKFLSIFLVPIYTRVFSTEEYGTIGLITTTMSLLQILAVLALDNSAARWFYETEATSYRKQTIASWVWCQLVVSIFLGAGMVVAADGLAKLIIEDPGANLYFRLSGIALPMLSLSSVVVKWLRFQRRATATMVYTVVTNTLTVLLTILFVVVLHRGLEGVYLAQLISAVVNALLVIIIMGDWVNPKYFRWPMLKEMLAFGLPLIPASLAFWVVNLSSRYFVQFYNSTSDVGLFQLGANIAMLTALVTNAFQQAWGPFSMSIYKRPESRQVYANVFLVFTCLTVSLCLAVALFAPEIIRIIATESYLGASTVVGVLSLSYVFIGLNYFANVGPTIVKDMRPLGIATILSAVIYLLLSFILVPRYGMFGAGLSTLLSQAFVPIFVFYRAQQLYPIPYRFAPAAGFLVYSVILVTASSLIDVTNLWLAILVKSGLLSLVIPALFLFKIVTLAQVRNFWIIILKRINPLTDGSR